ncbi:hypothetical protein LJR219_002369 [Phenylobacterium sp. LjRoot219]|uniref:hypothetical protein n=1 Tax=Phenylobacterium sp. LjRoot219 TaxID=3342283 RepID=UPI003ECD0DEB
MKDTAMSEPRSFARGQPEPIEAAVEVAELSLLLTRAGIEQASAMWLQLLVLANDIACDWVERSLAAAAPLSAHDAAALGLRTLAGEILSTPGQTDDARAAAEACLSVCVAETPAASPPERSRRWGEGALPRPPHHPSLLQDDAAARDASARALTP